jgi:hypothetical protein
MPLRTFPVCTDVDITHDDTLEFRNDSDYDCEVTRCKPPLEHPHYTVGAHSTVPANIVGPPGNYRYHCECHRSHTKNDPRLIVR